MTLSHWNIFFGKSVSKFKSRDCPCLQFVRGPVILSKVNFAIQNMLLAYIAKESRDWSFEKDFRKKTILGA